MKKVHGFGRIYWIIRDFVDLRTPLMCTGFMKETDYPWRHGKGVQIRTSKYTLQIGLCKRLKVVTETDGILQAIGGRYLDTPAREDGMW